MGFSVEAYFGALDQERETRDLTWAALTRELNAPFAHRPDIPPISSSTITGMTKKGSLNGNIVIHTLMWLGRPPEDFTPGHPVAGAALPQLEQGRLPRWNADALAGSVGAQRVERNLTWPEAARQVDDYTPAMLRNVDRSLGFPRVMCLLAWLGRPAAEFVVNVPV